MNQVRTLDAGAYIVVQEHCPAAGLVGAVVFVEEVEPPHPVMHLRCVAPSCMAAYAHNEAHALIAGQKAYHPLAWLKKLPPLDESEGESSWEEINTPVLL